MSAAVPVAFAAFTAKLVDLADEHGIRVTEVAELDELSAAAQSLLTRAERDQIIDAQVEQIAQEFLDEGVASGRLELIDAERGVYRDNRHAS